MYRSRQKFKRPQKRKMSKTLKKNVRKSMNKYLKKETLKKKTMRKINRKRKGGGLLSRLFGNRETASSIVTNPYYEDQSQQSQHLDEMKQTMFQFTRHLKSCNNLYGMLDKELEPGGSLKGILDAIAYAQKYNSELFNSEHVCVSNLYRTWITAFLLYCFKVKKVHSEKTDYTYESVGGGGDDSTFTMYICPWLKEKAPYYSNKGNYPDEIRITVNKFLRFFAVLGTFKEMDKYWQDLPGKVIIKLPSPQGYNDNSQEIVYTKKELRYDLTDYMVKKDTVGPGTNKGEGFIDDGDLERFMMWALEEGNMYIQNCLDAKKMNTSAQESVSAQLVGLTPPPPKPKRRQRRNVVLEDNLLKNLQPEQGGGYGLIVHVVTHSQIMYKYLRRFQVNIDDIKIQFDMDKISMDEILNLCMRNTCTDIRENQEVQDFLQKVKCIRESNLWNFKTSLAMLGDTPEIDYKEIIKKFDLHEGIITDEDSAKKMEKNYKKLSLCEKYNKVGRNKQRREETLKNPYAYLSPQVVHRRAREREAHKLIDSAKLNLSLKELIPNYDSYEEHLLTNVIQAIGGRILSKEEMKKFDTVEEWAKKDKGLTNSQRMAGRTLDKVIIDQGYNKTFDQVKSAKMRGEDIDYEKKHKNGLRLIHHKM